MDSDGLRLTTPGNDDLLNPESDVIPHLLEFYDPESIFHARGRRGLWIPLAGVRPLKSLWKNQVLGIADLQTDRQSFGESNEGEYRRAVKLLKRDDNQSFERYWSIHTENYLNRIDSLVSQLPENRLITDKTKAVVVIAAMDELEIKRAIEALERSYGDNFHREVSIIVYNNYKTSRPDPGAVSALDETYRAFPNVSVINEQVSSDNTVAMAKKVTTDTVLRYMEHTKHVPLVFTDADIVGLSQGSIQEAIAQIEDNENNVVAASDEYSFDPKAMKKFPNWGFVEEFRERMVRLRSQKRHNLIGPFTVISPAALANVGGIYALATFEDSALTQQINALTGYSGQPINTVNGSITIAPSKELSNMQRGQASDSHWQLGNETEYTSASGTRRLNWRNIDPIENPEPALAGLGKEFNPELAVVMLNDFWRNSSRFLTWEQSVSYTADIINFLKEHGIPVTFDVVKSNGRDKEKLSDVNPDEIINGLESGAYEYQIKDIKYSPAG